MKTALLFAVLIGLAAANLLLNVFVPPAFKLLLVPAFGLMVVAMLARARRSRARGGSPDHG